MIPHSELTRAPWKAVEDSNAFVVLTDEETPRQISCFYKSGSDEYNATLKAISRLIAAAPDLLAVCEKLQSIYDGEIPANHVGDVAAELNTAEGMLRAAIAKAREASDAA